MDSLNEDVSARILLANVVRTEPIRAPVTRSGSQAAVPQRSSPGPQAAAAPQRSSSRLQLAALQRSSIGLRRSSRVFRTSAGGLTPMQALKQNMRQKIRASTSLQPIERRTVSAGGRRTTTSGPAAASYLQYDEDLTPRHLLQNILRTEPEVSLLVQERSNQKELLSADSSLSSNRPSTGLDLPDVTTTMAASVKGLSRKRPRRTLNIADFEKRLGEDGDMEAEETADDLSSVSSSFSTGLDLPDVTTTMAASVKGLSRKRPRRTLDIADFEKRLGDDVNMAAQEAADLSSLSSSSVGSVTLSLKTPFVDIHTEKKGLQRKVARRQRMTVEQFCEALSDEEKGGYADVCVEESQLSEGDHSLPNVTIDILSQKTVAMHSTFMIPDTQAEERREVEEAAARSHTEEEAAASQTEEEAVASQTEEKEPADSQTEEKEPADSQTEEKEPADSQTEEEEAADSQTEEEEVAYSQTEEEEAADFQTEEKEPADSQTEEEEAALVSRSEDDEAGVQSQNEEEDGSAHSQPEEQEQAADSEMEEEDAVDAAEEEGQACDSLTSPLPGGSEHVSRRAFRSEGGPIRHATAEGGRRGYKSMGAVPKDTEAGEHVDMEEEDAVDAAEEEGQACDSRTSPLPGGSEHVSRRAFRSEGGLIRQATAEGGRRGYKSMGAVPKDTEAGEHVDMEEEDAVDAAEEEGQACDSRTSPLPGGSEHVSRRAFRSEGGPIRHATAEGGRRGYKSMGAVPKDTEAGEHVDMEEEDAVDAAEEEGQACDSRTSPLPGGSEHVSRRAFRSEGGLIRHATAEGGRRGYKSMGAVPKDTEAGGGDSPADVGGERLGDLRPGSSRSRGPSPAQNRQDGADDEEQENSQDVAGADDYDEEQENNQDGADDEEQENSQDVAAAADVDEEQENSQDGADDEEQENSQDVAAADDVDEEQENSRDGADDEEQENSQDMAAADVDEEQENSQDVASADDDEEQENSQDVAAADVDEEQENSQDVAAADVDEEQENSQDVASADDDEEQENYQDVASADDDEEKENYQDVAGAADDEEKENYQDVAGAADDEEKENYQDVAGADDDEEKENYQDVAGADVDDEEKENYQDVASADDEEKENYQDVAGAADDDDEEQNNRAEDGGTSPDLGAAQEPADQEVEEEWEDEEGDEVDELSMKTPAFIREKRNFLPTDPLASPTLLRNIKPSVSDASAAPAKPTKARAKRQGPAKQLPGLPKSYLMSTFRHFAKTKVSPDVYPVLQEIMDKFFGRMVADLETYAAHAKRKTIEVADCELLLRRQGYVSDKVPVEVLIEKYLSLEHRRLLIPCASSGNVVFPKLRR